MPRNGSGTMSIVHTASANTVITSSDWNQNLDDVAEELTNSLALDGQSTMTGQIKAANGTAAAPAIAFGSDTDMGWYRSGADEMSAATAGTQRLAVSSAGLDVKSGHYRKGGSIMSLVPIGTVLDYAGPGAPSGFLACDGFAVSRTTYAALFAVIGTTYGAGNGTTTFNVPDLRGRVTAGKDADVGGLAGRLTSSFFGANAATPGAAGGSESHTLTTGQLASHSHTGSADTGGAHNHTGTTQADGNHSHGGATGAGGAHNHTGATQADGTHDHGGATGSEAAHTHDQIRYNSQVNISFQAGATNVTGIWVNDQQVATGAGSSHVHTIPSTGTAHTHAITSAADHTHTISASGTHTHAITSDDGHTHTLSISNAGAGSAHNNVQPTLVLNKIIFAGA